MSARRASTAPNQCGLVYRFCFALPMIYLFGIIFISLLIYLCIRFKYFLVNRERVVLTGQNMAGKNLITHSRKHSKNRQIKEYETVVIRNLHPSTNIRYLYIELESLGFKVYSIRNATNTLTLRPVPIFFVKLEKNPANIRIFEIRCLARQPVLVERFRPNPEIPRCTICQGLNHLARDCSNLPTCTWCSGPHITRNCHLGKEVVPICSRCGGPHPANYKGCIIYKQYVLEAKRAIRHEESREENDWSVKSSGFGSGSISSDTSCSSTSEEKAAVDPKSLRELLSDIMEHYFSINKDLMDKLSD